MAEPIEPEDEGAEEPLTRAEMALIRRADTDVWPVPVKVQVRLLQRLIDLVDPESDAGRRADHRTVISAIRTIGALRNLRLKQIAIDMAREKMDREVNDKAEVSLADLVAEAEEAALKHESDEPPQ